MRAGVAFDELCLIEVGKVGEEEEEDRNVRMRRKRSTGKGESEHRDEALRQKVRVRVTLLRVSGVKGQGRIHGLTNKDRMRVRVCVVWEPVSVCSVCVRVRVYYV